jgi:excisionase family DNA binding protein
MSERLMTAAELAEQLGFSAGTIVDWAEGNPKKGIPPKLPGFRIGGRLRFRWSEVEAVLEAGRFGPEPCTRPERVA